MNGHTINIGMARLWVFLFGALYFVARGMWKHAILFVLLVIPTLFFGVWLYYVVTAPKHVRNHFLERGFIVT